MKIWGEEWLECARKIKEEWRREMNEAMLIVVVVGDEGEQHQSHDTTRVKKGEI